MFGVLDNKAAHGHSCGPSCLVSMRHSSHREHRQCQALLPSSPVETFIEGLLPQPDAVPYVIPVFRDAISDRLAIITHNAFSHPHTTFRNQTHQKASQRDINSTQLNSQEKKPPLKPIKPPTALTMRYMIPGNGSSGTCQCAYCANLHRRIHGPGSELRAQHVEISLLCTFVNLPRDEFLAGISLSDEEYRKKGWVSQYIWGVEKQLFELVAAFEKRYGVDGFALYAAREKDSYRLWSRLMGRCL